MCMPPTTETTATAHLRSKLGGIAGSETALRLMQSGLATSTTYGYGKLFDAFALYCAQEGVSALPASTATVISYVGYLGELGTWAASSMRPIFSAINDAHRSMTLDPPARGSFFLTRVLGGLGRVQAQSETQDSRTPLAADGLEAVLEDTERLAALPSSALPDLRSGCAIVLTALFLGRQDSSVHLKSSDLGVSDTEIWLRLSEKGKRKQSVRRIVRLPLRQSAVRGVASALPRVAAVLRVYLDRRAEASAETPEFAFQLAGESRPTTPSMERWLARCLARAQVSAPPGFVYQGHSLRSLGASAMAAIGVPRHVYVWLGGWVRGSSVVDAHYIDPTFQPSPAAYAFYGWALTSSYAADAGTVVHATTLPDPLGLAPASPARGPTEVDTPPHVRAARRIARRGL